MTRRCNARVFVLAGLFVIAAAIDAAAQGGRLRGEVTDEWGNGLAGVTIVVTGGGASREATTDENGTFQFLGLSGGEYTIEFRAEGYQGASSPLTFRRVGGSRPIGVELGVLPSGDRFREDTEFAAASGTPRIAFDVEGRFEFEDASGEGEGTYGIVGLTAVMVVREYDGPDDSYSVNTPVVVTFESDQLNSLTWGDATLTKQ